MKVTSTERPDGTLIRFESDNGSHTCWDSGTREILVSIDQTNRKCTVKILSGTDQAAKLPIWDDSHEDLLAHEKRNFTRLCLSWLEQEWLLSWSDRITEIQVSSEADFTIETEPLISWAGNLTNKFAWRVVYQ